MLESSVSHEGSVISNVFVSSAALSLKPHPLAHLFYVVLSISIHSGAQTTSATHH